MPPHKYYTSHLTKQTSLPFGQTLEQPLRTQDAQGNFLSHFSFSLNWKVLSVSKFEEDKEDGGLPST